MRWIVTLPNDSTEYVDGAGISIAPDGSLVIMKDQAMLAAAYSPGHWKKVNPSAIASGKIN